MILENCDNVPGTAKGLEGVALVVDIEVVISSIVVYIGCRSDD